MREKERNGETHTSKHRNGGCGGREGEREREILL
jgi:hypothetical protein